MKRLALLAIAFVIVGCGLIASVRSGLVWDMVRPGLTHNDRERWGLVALKAELRGALNDDVVVLYGTPEFVGRHGERRRRIGLNVHSLEVSRVTAPNLQTVLISLREKGVRSLVVEIHPLIWSDYHPSAPEFTEAYTPKVGQWTFAAIREDVRAFFHFLGAWAASASGPSKIDPRPLPQNLSQLTFHVNPPSAPRLDDSLADFDGAITFIDSENQYDISSNPVLIQQYEEHVNSLRESLAGNLPMRPDKLVSSRPEPEETSPYEEWLTGLHGYATPLTIVLGQDVTIRFAGDQSFSGARVTALEFKSMTSPENRTFHLTDPLDVPVAPCRSHKGNGCDFPGLVRVNANGLKPDLYSVHLITTDDRRSARIAVHIQLKKFHTDESDVAFVLPEFTWQAYNRFGKGSFYMGPYNQMREVSLHRPLPPPYRFGELDSNSPEAAAALVRLFRQHGRPYSLISELDLHRSGPSLRRFKLIALLVHDEYWTSHQRYNLESFLRQGGKLLVLGGNTCWWKVDFRGIRVLVDKSHHDRYPVFARRTGKWHRNIIGDPCERMLGTSYLFAGQELRRKFKTFDAIPEAMRDELNFTELTYIHSSGMEVLNPKHPIFTGLDLEKGYIVGMGIPLSFRELDGIPITNDNTVDYRSARHAPLQLKLIMKTHTFSTSSRFDILATAPVVELEFEGRGRVLNMGSHGWMMAAHKADPVASKIILNAYDYLTARIH